MPHDDVTRRSFIRTAGTGLIAAVAAPASTQLAPPDKQPPKLEVKAKQKKIGYAIVGLGKLSLDEILPAFGVSEHSAPVALVSGHRDKALTLAARYGIDETSVYDYDGFDRIAENPAIEAVFIVLPNHMHAEYTIRALRAKKHVLCEKPMAATSEECRQMVAAAKENDRKLMIAYRLHYEPNHLKAIELARSGKLGALKTFDAINNQNVEAPNIRLSRETAGGPVGDVGVYCLNAARYITGEEPTEVNAYGHQPKDDPRFAEVFESVSWQMKFPSGAIATNTCSFGTVEMRAMTVVGTKGSLKMDRAFGYFGQRLTYSADGQASELQIKPVDHFAAEMDHFAQCIAENKPPRTPGEEGWQDMLIVEAIHKSIAEGGRSVKIESVIQKAIDPAAREGKAST